MTFCNCALPSMTGSDDCCKRCINNNCAESQNAILDIDELISALNETEVVDIDAFLEEKN